MKKVVKFKRTKRIVIISIILIILLIGAFCFLWFKKDNKSDKQTLKKKTYIAYVKINPLVKLTFDSVCNRENDKGVCSKYTNKVTKMGLLNDDAKSIYKALEFKNKSLNDVIASLILTAKDNNYDISNVSVTTNFNHDLDDISTSIKKKISASVEADVKITFDYQNMIDEAKILVNESKYTVTFDSDGGTSVEEQIVSKDNTVIAPDNPTKDGYTFVEWQLDGKKYDFNTKVVENIVLKARWEKVETDSNATKTNTEVVEKNNNTEEKKCESKKFSKKYSYVYETKDVCVKEGNLAFFEISDNVDTDVFSYGCEEIVDDCGQKWFGVIFYKWSEELGQYKVNY